MDHGVRLYTGEVKINPERAKEIDEAAARAIEAVDNATEKGFSMNEEERKEKVKFWRDRAESVAADMMHVQKAADHLSKVKSLPDIVRVLLDAPAHRLPKALSTNSSTGSEISLDYLKRKLEPIMGKVIGELIALDELHVSLWSPQK